MPSIAKGSKTNNSYLSDKVALRANHLPAGRELYILDCYAGKGIIWQAVKELTGRKIVTLPIEISKEKDVGFHLPGDNRAYLDTLDLDQFDAIDLDAYGVPYQQLKSIFQREYHGAVFVTFIQSVYGQMPFGVLQEIGFSRTMIERTPSIFGERGWEYFMEWLALEGVKVIHHRSKMKKHYLYFNLGVVQRQNPRSNPKKKTPVQVLVPEPVLVVEEPKAEEPAPMFWRGSKRPD
jgi:hypothetical protein